MKHAWSVIFIFLAIIVLTSAAVAGVFFYYVYFDKPQQGSFISNSSGSCNISADTYAEPDFDSVKAILSNEQMIKDLPDDGSINLGFYHIFENCKVFDKIYYLTKGSIDEKNIKGDISITMPSEYAKQLQAGNICKIIQDARNSDNLAQTLNINNAQLVWKFSGMIKYKECFGI